VRSVSWLVASPPYRFPCHYGLDTSQREELVAHLNGDELTFAEIIEKIRKAIKADRFYCLRPELHAKSYPDPHHRCMACFTGQYPRGNEPDELDRRGRIAIASGT